MTTIAYRDGVIAYDSLETKGDYICNPNKDKHHVRDGVHFFLSGPSCDQEEFMVSFLERKIGENENLTTAGYIWDGEELWEGAFCSEDGFWLGKVDMKVYGAKGGGYPFAMGAMDMGATALEAVKIAAKRHTATGGRVRTFNLRKNTD